jgi:hypothetical protein
MATKMRKVTCLLKPAMVKRVQKRAKQWGVSRSEVIRLAIDRLLPPENLNSKVLTPMQVLNRLQKRGGISRKVAEHWCAEIRRERRASGIARGRRLEQAWAEAGLKY